MFVFKTRVRYAEIDQMGLAYHISYANYWEWARTEFIRAKGKSYKSFEELGFLLPCKELKINYHAPAKYDDVVLTETICKINKAKVIFEYKTLSENGILLVSGYTIHVFTNKDLKLCRIPTIFSELIKE